MAGFWTQVSSLLGPPGPQGNTGPSGPAGASGAVLQCQTLLLSTAVLAAGEGVEMELEAPELFHLLALESSSPCWLRLYGSAAGRSADSRTTPGELLPAAGQELYAELVTSAEALLIRLAPVPLVQTSAALSYLRLVNTDAVNRALALQFTVLPLIA